MTDLHLPPSSPSSPPLPPPSFSSSLRGRDVAGRQSLVPLTVCCSVIGCCVGVVYSVHSGYPLGRSAVRSSLNCALLSFTFLSSSITLSERGPQWPSSSLLNNAVAGGLTFAVMGGVREGGRGGLVNGRAALKVGAMWGLTGALMGATWWALGRGWGEWKEMRGRGGEASVVLSLPSEVPPSPTVGAAADWLPSWSPIRKATPLDLHRQRLLSDDRQRQQRERDSSDTSDQ